MSHSMSSHVSIKTMSVCAHIKIVPHLPAQASHLLHPHSIGARVHELCSDKVRARTLMAWTDRQYPENSYEGYDVWGSCPY